MSGGGEPRSWPSDADVRRASEPEQAKLDRRYRNDWGGGSVTLCGCPLSTVDAVKRGGTCHFGGCPYGGDF